ncbi:hypothetical protein Q0812_10430 [Brevundimonas sp. 2R-24]|uniref:Uncharacterized protein n=1 Tax=Peiella sedimenti TaxID=3061083 RepID=A0ABT8SMP6_9CAUL|nr:hypothetical protein [Caulobacteraceae bacterium XZ-24]
MDIFSFISEDELDRLPDDPQEAFIEMSRIAYRSLGDRLGNLDLSNDSNDWEYINEARLAFMNVMAAAASRYEIDGMSAYALPSVRDFQTADYRQFKSDLDHCVTQLTISRSLRRRSRIVRVSGKVRDRLTQHVDALRGEVEKSNLPEAQAKALLRRLDDFERELDKRRIPIFELAWLAVEIACAPGDLWSSQQLVSGLMQNVYEAVAEARSEEERAKALLGQEPQKAIAPPNRKASPTKPTFDMDDDIPF